MTFPSDDRAVELAGLLQRIETLRAEIAAEAPKLLARWGAGADAATGLVNLAEYVALRRNDLASLQTRLSFFGLTTLGRSEARVAATLEALAVTLGRLTGASAAPYPAESVMRAGQDALAAACLEIFGQPRSGAHTPVMATLPTEAANEPALVERLFHAGMDVARINCAHDDAGAWGRMIANIRAAERRLGGACKVFMDIAGPKCRIVAVRGPERLRVFRGDRIMLAKHCGGAGPVAITPSFPQIIDQLDTGSEIWINDGKIGARVVGRAAGGLELEIFAARSRGERLKVEKGLNFPTTELDLSPLTKKDFADLDFIAQNADIVGYSFVQRAKDVELLQDHLAARRAGKPQQPLALKIETPLAVRNLPELLVQAVSHGPTAVMIARGDLAVELGFARLSEMQEELLWLCEAAHVPVIWATQVLDQFVREGVMSRAETTDAAMAQRADCVMLNKGERLAEGITLLRDILARMDRFHAKNFARLSPLRAW